MSHVSSNTAALNSGAIGLTDPLLYHVINTQESMALQPGDGVILCRAIQPLTIALPQAGTCAGRAFIVMKIDQTANAVTVVSADMHDNINGVRQNTITAAYNARTYLSDGQNWWVINVI